MVSHIGTFVSELATALFSGDTEHEDSYLVSGAAFREKEFIGNYAFWTSAILLGVGTGVLYLSTKERMLTLLLRDLDWTSHPSAVRSKLYGMAVHFFSLGKKQTYSYQNNLPSLPLPSLKTTLSTYLASVKPFLTEDEFNQTRLLADEFQNGVGAELQQELVARAATSRNWLAPLWEEAAYLSDPSSLPTRSNWYGVGTTPDYIDHADRQIGRASQFVKAMLSFKKSIDSENYKPWKVGKGTLPLCMDQYKRLFGTCRVPGYSSDTIQVHPDSKHIIVWAKNRPYPLNLYDDEGVEVSLEALDAALLEIRAYAEKDAGGCEDVSYFTSLDRRAWAQNRECLMQSKVNAEALKKIESALFMLCLDDIAPENLEEQSREALLGLGNRWYDAAMQIVIFRNGRASSNMEHTGMDATIPASMLQFVLDNETSMGNRTKRVRFRIELQAEPLRWELSKAQLGVAQSAKETLQKEMKDYDLRVFTFDNYGNKFIKENHLRPDGFVQMALQLAYYKLNRCFAFTYESAATRLFYRGRTETIRSVSDPSVAFVQAMISSERDDEKIKRLLVEAIKQHSEYTRKASLGEGVDRPLLGLYIIAAQKGIESPFFKDKAYNLPSILSTSQTPCPNFPGGGFSPAHPDGYGIAYVVHGGQLIFHITSKHSSNLSDSNEFIKALQEALGEMKALYDPVILA